MGIASDGAFEPEYDNKQVCEVDQVKDHKNTYLQKPVKTAFGKTRKKDYDPRWLLCEACRHLFARRLRDAPYSLNSIECPECGHEVSTHPP